MTDPMPLEEQQVEADEQALPETAEPEQAPDDEPTETEYIEFVGVAPYGVEFYSEHTITRRQIRDAWDLSMPKDLKWTKAEGGPNKGRMLVPVSDMTPEVAAGLEKDDMFKRVKL